MKTAEEIVRALAACDEPLEEGYDTCAMSECGALRVDHGPERPIEEHRPNCPYRMAREWVERAKAEKRTCPECASTNYEDHEGRWWLTHEDGCLKFQRDAARHGSPLTRTETTTERLEVVSATLTLADVKRSGPRN